MKEMTLRGREIDSHIYLGNGLLNQAAGLLASSGKNRAEKVLIVTDTNVAKLYLKAVEEAFVQEGYDVYRHIIPSGEEYKNLASLSGIYETLAQGRFDRADAVVALGGGVIGDMAGYAAATYMRGMENLMQIPTTLLAQVDSSVGGKCGVDLPQGKNLVGVFRQPNQVILDPKVLTTLSEEILLWGMAEVVKYGCILAPSILQLASRPDYRSHLEELIWQCVDLKRQIVEEDETETGIRRILNFGHTIGHGIERLGHYCEYAHGEAVAVGMVAALKLGRLKNITSEQDYLYVESILKGLGLPVEMKYPVNEVYEAMMADKKKQGNRISFIFVSKLGKACIHQLSIKELKENMKGISVESNG